MFVAAEHLSEHQVWFQSQSNMQNELSQTFPVSVPLCCCTVSNQSQLVSSEPEQKQKQLYSSLMFGYHCSAQPEQRPCFINTVETDNPEVIAAADPHTLLDDQCRYDTVIPLDAVTALIPLTVSLLARWAHKGTRWSHQCWHGCREGYACEGHHGCHSLPAVSNLPPAPPPPGQRYYLFCHDLPASGASTRPSPCEAQSAFIFCWKCY